MANLSSHTSETAQNLLDYQVVDQNGSDIGTVHSFWADSASGNLEFIGVKTGWLFGQNHVIPVEKVEIDDAARHVRVPYTLDKVKGAMSLDADADITDTEETEIYRYYGLQGGTTRQDYATDSTTRTTDTTRTTGAANMGTMGAANVGTANLGTTGTAGYTDETVTNATTGAARTANTTASNLTGDDREVTLSEEEVKVGKRTVDAGQVRLRKIVRTEVVNQPVEIRHEDVVVERVSADQVHAGTATSDFKEEVIDVPLTREEVVVSKDAHVTGAVRLHKTAESETQNVSETVRKEDVEVLRDGKTVTERDDIRK